MQNDKTSNKIPAIGVTTTKSHHTDEGRYLLYVATAKTDNHLPLKKSPDWGILNFEHKCNTMFSEAFLLL